MENLRVPQHFRFIIPIIEVLKELGGSGRAGEVTDLVIEKLVFILAIFYVFSKYHKLAIRWLPTTSLIKNQS